MANRIRIVATSLATFEDTSPPFNLRQPSTTENFELAEKVLYTAAEYEPDIVLLPEVFLMAGQSFVKVKELSENIPGPGFNMLSSAAEDGNMNIVAGHMVNQDGKYFNQGLVLDRTGALLGAYSKNHPTVVEIKNGVTPGDEAPIFNLDCGRIGVAICFDINWPDLWHHYAENKVDLITWLSAYEGGFPLQSFAWQYKIPIATSVWPYHGRIVDITGDIVAETSRWDRIVVFDLNLDRALFHTDGQMQKINEIRKMYGDQIKITSYTELHQFMLESNSDSLSVDDVIAKFDLLTYEEYIQQSTESQNISKNR